MAKEKGSRGGHRQTYKGGRKRSVKRKPNKEFEMGERVIFHSKGNVLCGWIVDTYTAVPFLPGLGEPNSTLHIKLTTQEKPEQLQSISHLNISSGQRVFFMCDQSNDSFVQLKVATVLRADDDTKFWIRVDSQSPPVCVDIKKLCIIPDKYVDFSPNKHIQVCELDVLREIYEITRAKLVSVTEELQTTKDENSKLRTQVDDLDILHETCINQRENIDGMDIELQQLSQENTDLKTKKNEYENQLENLNKKVMIEEINAYKYLEKRPGPGATDDKVLRLRKKNSTGKPQTAVIVTRPDYKNESAKAQPPALDKRAYDLMKVLNVISNREEASHEDRVQTLAVFIKKNEALVREAVEEAGVDFHRVLTPSESVDLKLLLRLPWTRFGKMRTFFKNKGLPILSSKPNMYKILKERRGYTEDNIEIGTVNMKKTISAPTTTPVSFVRAKSLEDHVTDLLLRHLRNKNTYDHQELRGEIWIKIGGDKGGTSTKLVVQIVNVNNPNSCDNTDLLAFFEATDNEENMRLIFSIYTQMMKDMQHANFMLDLGEEFGKMRCRIFVIGDLEFLCKAFGHNGCGATYPCLWCHLKLETIRKPDGKPHSPKLKNENGHWVDNEEWPEDRELEMMEIDVQKNKEHTQQHAESGKTAKENSAQYHSLYTEPILPITTGIDHIVPPVLHIMLGLVQRYFTMLEELCKRIDSVSLGERDAGLNKKWEECSVEAQEKEMEWENEKEELVLQQLLLDGFKISSRGARGREEVREASAPCSMPACALASVNPWEGQVRARDNVKYFQCYECGNGPNGGEGWFHLSCVGLGEREYMDDQFQFLCPVCRGDVASASDVVKGQAKRVGKQKKCVNTAKVAMEKAKKELDTVYQEVYKQLGPKVRKLNEVLEKDLHVKKQAYHSQCFVGNHCKKILKESEKLVSVVDGHPEHAKYLQLFSKLNAIFHYSFQSRFLTPDEVDDLCDKCYDFGVWFPTNFVNEKLPPKFHVLVCAVPKCARQWRTIGLLSEHGLESIHAAINADERIYGKVRNNELRMGLVFKQHGQYAMADKTALKTEPRSCQMEGCDGRYVTIDKHLKLRHCKVCFHSPE